MLTRYAVILKPFLIRHIDAAIDEAHEQDGGESLYPWLGPACYEIMADAALCVLRGMADAEAFLQSEGLLE
jgi:hypothetical protein